MIDVLSPPLAFVVALAASALVYAGMGRLSYRPPPGQRASSKPYACGEDSNVMVRPDYSQVFPFAFYFTILHVVALMATTLPDTRSGTLGIAVVYVLGAIMGLFVLYRK